MNSIVLAIKAKAWEKLIQFSLSEIVQTVSFKEGVILAHDLLYNKNMDDEISEFAIDLLQELQLHYPGEWGASWKYDALLGNACNFLCRRYELKYKAYKRAVQKADPPPANLLALLASCYNSPGIPPITSEETERYALMAVEKKEIFSVAALLRDIYEERGEEEKACYWNSIYQKFEEAEKVIKIHELEPEFLQDKMQQK